MQVKRMMTATFAVVLVGVASADVVYQEDFQKIGGCPAEIQTVKGEVGFDNEPCWEQYFAMRVTPNGEFLI